jgi:5-methylcytosine-specific restriction endonuclease McrA
MIRPGDSARRRRERSGVPGRLGIVRLYGKALEALRLACVTRDEWRCVKCGEPVTDRVPEWAPHRYHMAHIVSRGAGGSDVLENVRTLCGCCHAGERSEHNCNGKPLPRK